MACCDYCAGSVFTLTHLPRLAYVYKQRDQAFPLISDFQSDWVRQFISLVQADMTRVVASFGLATVGKRIASHLELEPGIYPGISMAEPVLNWLTCKRCRWSCIHWKWRCQISFSVSMTVVITVVIVIIMIGSTRLLQSSRV